jgi:hypothetical protein
VAVREAGFLRWRYGLTQLAEREEGAWGAFPGQGAGYASGGEGLKEDLPRAGRRPALAAQSSPAGCLSEG